MDKRDSTDKVFVNKHNTDNNTTSLARKVWKIYIPVALIGLIVATTMWYAMSTGSQIAKQYHPLVDASLNIKLKTTIAHLWFEEVMSGDQHENIDEVWKLLNQAEWYAQAMLSGGQKDGATYIPIDDPKLRQDILEVLENIRAFRNIAKERFASIDESFTGSEIDQRFDTVFRSFLKQADNVGTILHKVIYKDIQHFHLIQIFLIALSLILTAIVGVILNRYEQKQAGNLSMLKAANQQLTSSEQQLKAANQQLQASEQQLKATNQQLYQSLQKLALHIQQTPLGVIQWDLNFKVTEWNKAAEKMFGFTSEEAIGRHSAGLIVPESIKPIVDKVWNDLITQKGGNRSTNENITKNGETIICEWYNTPLIDENDQTIGVASLVMDITKRKKAEEQILFLSSVVKQSADGMAIANMEGKLTFVNEAWAKMHGYEKTEKLIDKSLDIFHNEKQLKNDVEPFNRLVHEKGSNFGEVGHIRRDGTIFPTRMMTTLMKDENGKPIAIVGVATDITERKQAEEALHKSEERFKGLVEQSPLSIQVLTLDGKTIRVNKAWEQLWGATLKDLKSYNILEDQQLKHLGIMPYIIRGFKGEQVAIPDAQYDSAKTLNKGLKRWVRANIYPVRGDDGAIRNIILVHENITDRKIAEGALRESEEKFRRYINSAPYGFFIVDAHGHYVEVNQAACDLTGYTKDELTSMSISDIIDSESKKDTLEGFEELKIKGVTKSEFRLKRKDGSIIWVSLDAVALSEDRFMAFCSDIAETKRLQKLESRAERLEMAGTIAGQVAHDFNNLLGPIMAYPELIRDEFGHDHKARAYLEDIESAAKKIADINQDLLTMGRRGHYNQDVLDLNQIVLQTVKELDLRSKTVISEIDLSENLMNIKGGAAQIHRLLTNLLVNAQDAIQNIGKITIKTENYYADDTSISFGRVPKGEYIKLTITDTGCGIPENIIQKIIDPFFSTKTTDKERGSGLGLSVVDAVVKDHNGYLDLSSKVGHGTSFYVYFPITRKDVDESKTYQTLSSGETILVVDDDEIQREVATVLLKKLGYIVNTVESGEKAVEFLKENPQDLVILDMVMPGGINGTETFQQILKIYPKQKAIVLSGFSETDQVLKVQKLGAGAFVKKPVTKKDIAAAVRTELDRSV